MLVQQAKKLGVPRERLRSITTAVRFWKRYAPVAENETGRRQRLFRTTACCRPQFSRRTQKGRVEIDERSIFHLPSKRSRDFAVATYNTGVWIWLPPICSERGEECEFDVRGDEVPRVKAPQQFYDDKNLEDATNKRHDRCWVNCRVNELSQNESLVLLCVTDFHAKSNARRLPQEKIGKRNVLRARVR
jgi:hypothetical protein